MRSASNQESKKIEFKTSKLLAAFLLTAAFPLFTFANSEEDEPGEEEPQTNCQSCSACTKHECEYEPDSKIKYENSWFHDAGGATASSEFVCDNPDGYDVEESSSGCLQFTATGTVVSDYWGYPDESEVSYGFSYSKGVGWYRNGGTSPHIRDSYTAPPIDPGPGHWYWNQTETAGCEEAEMEEDYEVGLHETRTASISVESGGSGSGSGSGGGGGGGGAGEASSDDSCSKSGNNSDGTNGSIHFKIGLANDSSGDRMGNLELYAEEWSSDLTKASSLIRWEDQTPFSNDAASTITVSLDTYQVVRTNLGGGGYTLDFQEPAGGGTWTTYRSYDITSPSTEVLLIREYGSSLSAERAMRYTHSYDSMSGKRTWILEKGLENSSGSFPASTADRYEKVTKWTDDNGTSSDPSDDTDYEVRTVWTAEGTDLVAAQKRVYEYFGDSKPVRRISEWTWGTGFNATTDEPTGDLKTRTWTRYDNGRTKTYINEDGDWEAIQYTNGDRSRVIKGIDANQLTTLSNATDWDNLASDNIEEERIDEFIDLERTGYTGRARVEGVETFVGGVAQGGSFTIKWPHADSTSINTRETWEIELVDAGAITTSAEAYLIDLVDDYESSGHSGVSDRLTIRTKYKSGTTIGSGTTDVAVGSRIKEVTDWTGQVTEYTYYDNDQDSADYAEVTEVVSGWPGERVRRTTTEDADWRKPIEVLVEQEVSTNTWARVSRVDTTLDASGRSIDQEYRFGAVVGTDDPLWDISQTYACCGIDQSTARNGVITSYLYDERGYLKSTATYEPNGIDLYGFRVNVYDPNGRVIATAIDADDTYPSDDDILSQTNLSNTIVTGIMEYDGNGRVASQTDALGNKMYYAYNEVVADSAHADFGKLASAVSGGYTDAVYQETRVYPDHSGTWAGGSDAPPIQIAWTDAEGRTVRRWTASSTATWSSSAAPAGTNVIGSGLTELSRTEYLYDWADRATHVFSYETLPSGYASTVNATTLAFSDGPVSETEYNVLGQGVRQVDASGNITAMVYDGKGRVSETWLGTDATSATDADPSGGGATGNNMKKVSVSYYDTDRDGTGDERSYATRIERLKPGLTSLAGTSADYVATDTDITWSSTGRVVASKPQDSLSPWTEQTYDMQGRLLKTESFVNNSNSKGALIAKSENIYDDTNDQPWRLLATKVYEVNAGVAGNHVETSYGYDDIERQVSTASPTGAVTKSEYDGYGRMVRQLTVADTGSSEPSSSDDLVISETVYGYDAAGQVITMVTYDRLHNAALTTGLLSATPALTEARYSATWHDEAGRVTHTADYGNVSP